MAVELQNRLSGATFTTEMDEASATFVGKWNRLVSRTNWEKGRIICQWREALLQADVPTTDCSDEAWAMRVGGVSGGHVGRLRRVWQRFGASFENYDGLYWTHFLVAMDWEDAEMWLEGAAQSGWSVSQMRAQRWEVTGSPEEPSPTEDDAPFSEWDEDSPLVPMGDAPRIVKPVTGEEDDAGFDDESTSSRNGHPRQEAPFSEDDAQLDAVDARDVAPTERVRPFAHLPELPDDLAEAFEQFKVAIVTHRMNGWRETSCDNVLAVLEALRTLALAPLEDNKE